MQEITTQLLQIAREQFDEEDLVFDAQTPFDDIVEWDSLNHIRMVAAMEDHWSIRFDGGELQDLRIVGDLAALIRTKIAP